MSEVHQYDSDGFYVGPTDDYGGPMPHGCAAEAPPEVLPDGSTIPADHQYRRLADGRFELVEDHRGQTGYAIDTGKAVAIKAFGPWPEDLAREPKPGQAYEYLDGQWVYNRRLDCPGPGYEFDEDENVWIKTIFSVFTFLNLFTLEEKAAIKKAIAGGNFEAAAIYDSFITADYINLRNQDTIGHVRRLASADHRLLTEERAA